jgi:DNA mismatch repair protein MutS2
VIDTRNETVFSTLEFDVMLKTVTDHAYSSIGREILENASFLKDGSLLTRQLESVTEMRDLLQYDDPFPFQGFSDFRQQLKKVGVKGAFLLPEVFLALMHFLAITHQVKQYLTERSEKYPRLQKIGHQTVSLKELESKIGRVVDAKGEIKDSASEALSRLRQEIEKKSSRVRQRLESILHSMVSQKFAQEDQLVIRQGRFVIPMKEGFLSRLKGVVVDQSASGATVFVEPLDVLDMNNEINRLRVRERHEMERILVALTCSVHEKKNEIENNLRFAGELDSIVARAKFSAQFDCHAAEIGNEGILNLQEARHPILLLKEEREKVVPLSLRMEPPQRTLIITGPNAGGKTVALKTVGLLVLMHQHGFHIPAAEGT